MTDAPTGFAWRELVEQHVGEHGGWSGLGDELVRRIRLGGQEPPELTTVIKGLRRLAARANGTGGQYGAWLLRHFGLPLDVHNQLKWLAQYHGRFADLPTSIREEHLRKWDRPPISESRYAAWVHIGLASVHHRRQERQLCLHRLDAARRCGASAGALASLEALLLEARVASDDRDTPRSTALLTAAERLVDDQDPEHLPYRARLNGQRAYLLSREGDLEAAESLFVQLPEASGIPFVEYRRTAGLAYHAWRSGDSNRGQELARLAAEHAADGGYVRFRVMALNLLARMVGREDAARIREHAARLARSIGDLHLEEVARRHTRS